MFRRRANNAPYHLIFVSENDKMEQKGTKNDDLHG